MNFRNVLDFRFFFFLMNSRYMNDKFYGRSFCDPHFIVNGGGKQFRIESVTFHLN